MFAICLESSHQRGMGHLYRMRQLALLMRSHGTPFIIFLNDHPPAVALLERDGLPFEVVDLERDGEWAAATARRHGARVWINDRLGTRLQQAQMLREQGVKLATLDDRGDGARLADLHIAALAFDPQETLGGLRVLRGLDYLILNPEIAKWRRRRHQGGRTLVTLGGSDTFGATVKVVSILRRLARPATVVIGPGFAHREALDAVLGPDFELKAGVPSLIAEMGAHDLAITGGGMTSFEAAASGLPVIPVANEWFEVPIARHLESLGAARFAGHHSAIDESVFTTPLHIDAMSAAGLARVPLDGAERVYAALLELA